jgi:serine/alanine adding enzyme
MIRVFASTPTFSPYAYAALNDSGEIVAMLVSIQVKTLQTLTSLSSRAVQFAEPLCSRGEEGQAALRDLIAEHDAFMGPRSLLCEIRSIRSRCCEEYPLVSAGYSLCDYVNYVVDLNKPKEQVWRDIKKSMRQKINCTAKHGVVVRDDNSLEGIARLYQLLKFSYGRSRVPLAPRSLFENTLSMLPPGTVRIRTAFENEKPVASIISLLYGGRIFSWYGGTLRLSGKSPFACIVWGDMEWGGENGYSIYDFGGAGRPDENYGPRQFKASFGGEEVHFGRYLRTYSAYRLKIAELAYSLSRRFGAWSSPTSFVDEPELSNSNG